MVEKYGSDQIQLGNTGGAVQSQDNAVMISGDSAGESALLFGPAALREIQAGVANGSFAIPPSDSEATITADNALPYWTFTDVNSAGAITAALVADSGAASGYVLRFTVASGTLTGKSATLTRFVPVASSASRSFSFYAEATFDSGTSSTQSEVQMTGEFYKADQTTTTGSPITSDNYAFNFFALGPTGITAPDVYAVSPDLTTMTAPADAAFIKLTITVSTVATQSADRTIDLTEVRLAHGLPELLLTDKDDPGTNPPALITHQVGVLSLVSGTQDTVYVGPITGAVASSLISLTSGGDIDLNPDAASAVKINGNNSNFVSRVTATAAQSLTNNTLAKITFNTASSTPTIGSYDPQTWFDNANDRIVIGQDGFYNITANIGFDTNATGRRLVQIFVNGSDRGSVQVTASTAGSTLISVSTNVYLAATDYVEVHALQQSGGALNTANVTGVYPVLSVGRIGA